MWQAFDSHVAKWLPQWQRWNLQSKGERKKDVTPLLTHWSYIFLALTHGNDLIKPVINHDKSQEHKNQVLNSWWPCDALWQHRPESTLALIMTSCLMAPCHYKIALRLISLELTDDKTLVQVLAWCHQATNLFPDVAKTFGPLPDQRTNKTCGKFRFYWSSNSLFFYQTAGTPK